MCFISPKVLKMLTKEEIFKIYAPHHVKCVTTDFFLEKKVSTMTYSLGEVCHFYNFCSPIEDVKPILRPFSEFEKEIITTNYHHAPMPKEERFKKIVPATELAKQYDFKIPDGMPHMYINNEWTFDALDLPYKFVQKLLEWHFDVFGILPKGEAVDMDDYFNDRI